MPKISVIVPVYNVEAYLIQCIESILAQTFKDIEIICVDDGSTDGSGKILDDYAMLDKRIKVLHQFNAGYGAAMNAGLDMASGDYIGIVESDDWIQAEMYEKLYVAAIQKDLDLVKSDAIYCIESIKYFKKIHYPWLDQYYDRILYDEDRNILFDFFMNIWTGIYKRQFLLDHNIRFHESPGAAYQDNGFWIQTLGYCQKAEWLSQAFYFYRQDNPGASVKNKSQIMAMTREYEFLERVLCDREDYRILPYCYYYKLLRHRGTFRRISDESKRGFCEQIKRDFALYKGFIKGNTYLENWLHGIVTKPDEMCRKIIEKKRKIRDKLEQAEEIIIYGAGRQGDIVFRGLYNEKYYGKVKCFAVSGLSSENNIMGKEILTIQEAYQSYPKAMIILAVIRESEMYKQMVKTLSELGINDYMDGSDIEENFYTI